MQSCESSSDGTDDPLSSGLRRKRQPRIVVIGAGLAGLAATRTFLKNGFTDVTILEASDRIGGRVQSVQLENAVFELGATWIHGAHGNPIYHLAEDNGLLEKTTDSERSVGRISLYSKNGVAYYLTSNGKRIPKDEVEEFSDVYNETFVLKIKIFKTSRVMSDQEYTISVFTPKSIRNAIGKINAFSPEKTVENQLKMVGCPILTESSLTSICELKSLKISAEKRSELEPAIFPTGAVVSLFTVGQGTVYYVSVPSSVGSVLVPWASRDPSAPELKIKIPRYILHKVLRYFFIPSIPSCNVSNFHLLSIVSFVQLFHPFTKNITSHPCSSVNFIIHRFNFSLPSMLAATIAVMHSLRCFPPWQFCPLMANILFGKNSLLTNFTDSHLILNICHGSVMELITGNQNIPKPRRILRSAWGSNPYIRGSYSYTRVGSSGADVETLAKPLPYTESSKTAPMQVMFAGEATHRKYYSTTHGALVSGETEASRLIEMYQDLYNSET
uniref:Amine oxidase domain-containing protein n=1 Tax=Latimeria chalumnae TaxID=7897 RepID=H3A4P4_LATCH